ncbi:probable conjugal transfer protein traA [Nitrobacter sp. Nb-311A]|nr:probable conjugal transfer protein traA [Nitrobacter sp. Nb-311A]
MAIYHLHVKVIGRKAGSSAVASAAYRSASRTRDERIDRVQDFSNKRGVGHSEVLLPENAPEAWSDRERLWNDVEAFEVRKDAQLAREVEFAIPREMTQAQSIMLARDFAQAEFVDRGMIADLNLHWDIGEDGMPKPHAHVMLTMRSMAENGFGPKVREWNRTEMVERWRERWAEHVNERLAELDIDARIDHRSLEAQGIGLEPQSQIGAPAQRIEGDGIEAADRADLHREIARNNGARIIADPSVALDAITHQQSTFTRRDMAMFAHRHSDGVDQFNEVMGAMRNAPGLVELGKDGRSEDRFTTRDMIEAEQRLHRAAELMAEKELHEVSDRNREAALARVEQRGLVMFGEQADALTHVTDGRDLGIVVGYAGTGKSAMLGVAREVWEAAGFEVRGVALSGIAAENLESGAGMHRAPSPAWSMAGRTGATCSRRAMCLSSTRRAWSARGSWSVSCPMPPTQAQRSCWSATRSSCNPSKQVRRSARSMSDMAARKSARCAASARTGSVTLPAIWLRPRPAMRSMPMTVTAWCIPPKHANRRVAI